MKIALAYCSGHFKGPVLTRSLLTDREDFITIQMNVEKGQSLDQATAMTLLNKYWAPKFSEQLSTMRSFANG